MHSLQRLLLLVVTSLSVMDRFSRGQTVPGEYPSINALSTFRPVDSSSVCGVGGPEDYCVYTVDSAASLLPQCMRVQCDNTCPFSSMSPMPLALASLSSSFNTGVSATQGRPGRNASALRFQNSSITVPGASVPVISSDGFSFATWINQDQGNEGALVAKVGGASGSDINYAITVSSSSIILIYLPTGSSDVRTFRVDNLDLSHTYWHHIAVTVFEEDAAFYVNGSVVGLQRLDGPIMDDPFRDVKLGQIATPDSSYNGLLQDIYYYNQALTAREMVELVTGSLPFLRLSTECHCPPSHPLINPQNQASCTQHSGNFVPRGNVGRLNSLSHPVGYINDLSRIFEWISAPGVSNVNITMSLTDSLYEVFLVTIQFSAPRPKAAVLETSRDGGLTYRPVQYFADDCMFYFGLPDNGPILAADDVNCITSISSQLPTSNGNLRFRFINQATRNFNLDTSPEFRDFILASHLRLRLVDYFTQSTSVEHRYYAIQEISVAARCACNGHASRCGTDIDSICQCEHNTEGSTCETCLPTHSDKSWRYGTSTNGFPCKPCRCNGHATTCVYDATVDPFPESYEVGGGGVCQNCQNNTDGVNCETCRFGFFRPSDRLPSDPDPCQPCMCHPNGITDQGDCVKDQGSGGQIIGQCFCKTNVIGLKCDVCRPGFSNLTASDPDGCSSCGCNTAGTFNSMDTCDSDTGQCLCKDNVMGLKCDRCRVGTTSLSASNPLGCEGCSCDPLGSVSSNCGAVTGLCICRPGVMGARCDQCLPGFTGLSAAGCVQCSCNVAGSTSNVCDSLSGQCPCLSNAVGVACDTCATGFYNISAGCIPCDCGTAGTSNGTTSCDFGSGQCVCKSNVQGRTCDTCVSGHTALLMSNPEGCSACDCVSSNTDTSGVICDPLTSQCACVSSATGLRCELCQDGFYTANSGCEPCGCDLRGSTSSVCNKTTGDCFCQSAGVTGRTCDTCFPGFFQFPSCSSCGCDAAGAVEGTLCDQATGVCSCKQFVTGAACDQCMSGFQNLEASNPFGCSAPPNELAPPTLTPSDSSIFLMWLLPEVSNGFIQGYSVFQDNIRIATVSQLNYTSENLQPNTNYSFFIEAFNSAGSTRSAVAIGRTLEGVPSGIAPPMFRDVRADSIAATWSQPTAPNGVITRYELVMTFRTDGVNVLNESVVFSGTAFTATVSNLLPFTVYSFLVRACTVNGCGSSETSQVQTLQGPPTFQMAPNVSTLTATSLFIEWEEPQEPNGIVIQYEIRQRESPFQGSGVFLGNVSSTVQSFTAANLRPFTAYEFSVVSYTDGGGTRSEWSSGITAESVPEAVQPPVLLPVSSSVIQVSWSLPQIPNGVIIRYSVFQFRQDGSGELQVATSPDPGSAEVSNLSPFTEYFFVLEACTAQGCSRSQASSAFSQEGVPSGQLAPQVNTTTPTSVSLSWDGPLNPNGVISSYSVLRRAPSLIPSPLRRDVGVAFDGNVIKRFSSDDNALGGISNTITFSFRTFSPQGTILYYINTARTDYLAVELRNGTPWFLFDAGSGPAVIQLDLGGADVTFNNGEWHSVTAMQTSRTGRITVDGMYSGTGTSSGSDQVISSRQLLHVGGIPDDLPRGTTLGLQSADSTLNGRNYGGCLFGLTLNGQPVDFSSSMDLGDDLIADIPGCAIQLEPGLSFLGGGFLSFPPNTLHSGTFIWSFDIRSTHTQGLVFFAYGANQSTLAVEIRDSLLHLVLSDDDGGSSIQRISISNSSVCDGQWHTVLLDKSLNEVFVSLDGIGRSLFFQSSDFIFSSSVFLGGVPMGSMAYNIARGAGVNVYAPFSGCMRPQTSRLVVGGVTSPELVPNSHQLVRFDGCHSPSGSGSPPAAASCVGPWASMSSGTAMEFTDTGLQPWAEYLYRIQAHNSAGFTASPWIATITQEAAPSGIGIVSLVSRTSTSLTVSWNVPTASNGLITRYEVTFTPVRIVGLDSPAGVTITVPLSVGEPEMVLLAVAGNLQPATSYSTTLSALTSGGTGTGPAVEVTTEESVPIDVQAPIIVGVGSRELTVTWSPPATPNGFITLYNLYVDRNPVFSGSGNITIVTGLLPFAEYTLMLEACTSIGCANSSTTIGQTLPDAPSGLAPPILTVLGPSSILARWQPPANPNGVITRFELRRLLGTESAFEVVFNDVDLDLETTITGLLPNTLYTFQLLAFNAGGSVASATVQALTLQDIPDDISPPSVDSVGSTFLVVSWSPPAVPNGDIILYNLTLNGQVVFSSQQDLSYTISDLQPFTSYLLAVIACTVRGCGSSNDSMARTLEDVPAGYVQPTVLSVSPIAFSLDINPVTAENGIVVYVLYISGDFQSGATGELETQQRTAFNSSVPSVVQVTNLVPFTNYTLFLEVSNSAGLLSGPPFTVLTLPSFPEEFLSPSLSLLNATSILVVWTPPLRPNGLILSYQVTRATVGSTPITTSHDLSTMAILTELSPFTLYLVSVSVTNTEGTTVSPQANITTGETAPSGFDRIVLLERGSRHISISWDPPAMSNGILVNYTVVQGGRVIAATPPTAQDYNVTNLLPFTAYNFSVLACTSVDCVESPSLMAMTQEDIPEGLSAPFVSASAGQSVLIVWTPPLSPNGILLLYRVERRMGSSENSTLVTIGTLPGSAATLVVGDTTTTPFTEYSYRVVAENSAGSVESPFTLFLTPEEAPEDVLPPSLMAISFSIIQVSFAPPLRPQGNITMYTITRSSPNRRDFSFSPSTLPPFTSEGTYLFNDTNLLPFTNYTYVLRVCTGGGCTDSDPSVELTLEDMPTGLATPTAVTVSSSEIMVAWMEPSMPNGVIQAYDLFRLSMGFERVMGLAINCCEVYLENAGLLPDQCTRVIATTDLQYLDTNLGPFAFYSYCIVATNNADSASSALTPPTQTSPAPMPLIGPSLNATTINSTAIFLQWDSLDISELLGPLDGYTLYARIAGTPGLGDVVFQGDDEIFIATGLLASTAYIFVVQVSNGVGSSLSNNASATTEEGIPAGLPAPQVVAIRSDALSVLILEPAEPNGVIILYSIILDSQLVQNVSSLGMVLLEGLVPFTLYTVQLEACTRFGCTRSPLVGATTLESTPVGLGSPFVVVTGPNSVEISWSAPNQPNGNITDYRILQRQQPSDPPVTIFSGLAFSLTISNLLPFTSYSFQVVAENGAGNVTSIPTMIVTRQAPPSSLGPPSVVVVSSTEIVISWSPPERLNGEFVGYQVYRNGEPTLSELTTFLIVLEQNLSPFTEYQYFIEVCATGGCVNSSSVSNTTFEALPEMLSNLTVPSVSPRSLVLAWDDPGSPNGEITEYIVTQLGIDMEVFRGLGFTTTVSNLRPFTEYSFHLMVCNSVGCATSNVAQVRTLETDPEGLNEPLLRNLTSTSVAIEWSAPAQPNGNITTYILRRGNNSFPNISRIIFQGLATSFNDLDLIANTLYFYTVEAVNGGGSVISSPSFFQTVPDLAEGIRPPTLDVRGPTEIAVTWSAPDRPNGEISAYRLFMDNEVVFTGMGFSYLAANLSAFTTYSFFVEVCNQAGCASSITVSAQTDQALPAGVAPPTLTVLGPTTINISWTTPAQPNGVITQYQIRRRRLNQPFTEMIQHVGPASILSFPNSGLFPFTSYEYRLRVTNGAGSVFSEWTAVRTSEDIPAGVSLPVFGIDNVFARNVTATWSVPTSPNGIILRYVLEYRLAIDPITFGAGLLVIAQEVPANMTTATATDLTPVTEYEFRVVAVNSAGRGAGPFEVVITSEDVPEGIQPIIVEQRTGSSLVLTWNPPLTPNGIVREYMVLLDGETVYRDSALTHTVSRLQPFTSYSIQLAACTSAGCTFGRIQSATTAEVTPFGQGKPSLSVVESRSVLVIWSPPVQPNGIITRYEVLRQVNSDVTTLSSIFSTDEVLNLTYLDTNTRPAQSYQYAIRAINSAGQVESDLSNITTPETAPEGLTVPILIVVSASMIQVSWLPPTQPNGVITRYRAFRTGGGSQNVSVFSDPVNRGFTDENLVPFTAYTYVIQACTAAGCALSPLAIATTSEDTPTGLAPPTLVALSETSISIVWEEPTSPNGVITIYNITIQPVQIIVILREMEELARIITNLRPFTLYAVTLEACNSAGCISSNSPVRTLESTPEFAVPPQASTINATALNVMWLPPAIPNGVIVLYELRRNGTLVFSGDAMAFVDAMLMPNQSYVYTIQAYTAVGAGQESALSAVFRTPLDTPEGVSPPNIQATSSTSILATWREPDTPNGVILRYILLLNGERVFEMLGFQFQVDSLTAFTTYNFQLMVCTTTCGSSSIVRATTLEAPPEGQMPPRLSEDTTRAAVTITWSAPLIPNGIITQYQLERRQVFENGSSTTEFIIVFDGSALTYMDMDSFLRPAMTYHYRVTATNSAGTSTSDVSSVTLSEAAPEDVPLPLITNFTSTSITVLATPPATPNGVLTAYRLLQNGTQVQTIVPPETRFVVTGLGFFTVYEFVIEACTAAGCTRSGSSFQRTGEAPPTGLSPPVGVVPSQQVRVIEVRWTPPQTPNGIIISYSLWYRRACPQPPLSNPTPGCIPGPLLVAADNIPADQTTYTLVGSGSNDPLPYTSYEFIVGAANREGSVNSSFSEPDTITPPSVPEIVRDLNLQPDFQNGVINLDWSLTFRLNGILRHYDLERNSVLLTRNMATSISLPQEPQGITLTYVITAVTESGAISATITTRINGVIPPTPNVSTTQITITAFSEPTNPPFYQEAAFIVGMVVLGVILLFILCSIFLCCVRPRGKDLGQGLQVSRSFQVDMDHHRHSPSGKQYSKLSGPVPSEPRPSPERHHHVTGSWSPGEPYMKGEIPDIDDPSEIFALSSPTSKSYSPSKVESLRMTEQDHQNRLSDYVISNSPSPQQFGPAKDDFGSFKHTQQQIFEDTKV